jgi:hypothetical protein
MASRTLNAIPASAVIARTASINPQSTAPSMFDRVVCVGGDEGEILIADNLCKIAFSVEMRGSDISHIGRPMSEHLALMCREIALSSPLYLNE